MVSLESGATISEFRRAVKNILLPVPECGHERGSRQGPHHTMTSVPVLPQDRQGTGRLTQPEATK